MATSSNFSTSNQYIKYRIVVDEQSTSIPNNTSSVRVRVQAWRTNTGYTTSGTGTCYCNINGTNYSQSISNSQQITYNSYTTLFDRTVTITHNADGSKTIYVSAYISHARFSSSSQGFNVTLTTIPRQATLTSAPDFNDVDNPTIQYSNPAGTVVTSLQACISLTGSNDDIAYRDISMTGTSYTFELTEAERNVLRAATPNSNTLSVKFYVKTVLSGNTYYSTLTKTMTIVNANPTITGAAYADTNSATTAITSNNQKIIQGQSTVAFSISSLAALKYATLSQVVISVNAYTVYDTISGSTLSNYSYSFGTINSSSNLSATIKVVDSRGNSTTVTLPITMLAWSLPTAIITCSRLNNFYTETTLNVDALYSSLDGNNTITIQYQYKQVTASSWSALQSLQDNVPATVNLDNNYQWNVKVIVTDRIGSTTYNLTVERGIPIIFFDRLNRSVGVNCFPLNENSIESDGLVLDDIILIGSQTLFDYQQLTSVGYTAVLGTYDYKLVDGIFSSVSIPQGYEKAYKVTAQVSTNNGNYGKVKLNNIESNGACTWSGQSMRALISTRIFKQSEITLEPTYNYPAKNGTNLYLGNTATGEAYFYNVTVHGYLVKTTTTLPQTREADIDLSS